MSIKFLVKKEIIRQKKVINLIPSENFVSENVLAALGSSLTNKYAEGKSHQRYYFGNEVVDKIEDRVKELALEVFKVSASPAGRPACRRGRFPISWGVNVQPYSGSVANLAAYVGALNLGDPVLAMSLDHGGHLTHGHKVSLTGKLFNFKHYGVDKNGRIDYKEILKIARNFRPKLIVCGATAYPRKIDFKEFSRIAKSVGALLMADISHIAGLIAGGLHQPPFPYCDIVTTTTQKTLRGPRGAMIFAKKELMNEIDKAVFPGLQGGPHLHTIAAIGVCLEEALKPDFKKYAWQTVINAKALATELKRLGFKLISGGTDNHLMLIDVTPLGMTGKEAGEKLERVGIVVNKNTIPYDPRKPWDPSGIRLGTPAVTTQGMKEKDMIRIARKIHAVLTGR
jgi:glycine hydroxymethyltransferase